MAVQSLRLQNFRSYIDSSFEFEPGVNIVVGPNASGKTNLLEALLVGAQGSSYRGPDRDLVSHDKPWARLDIQTTDGERTVKLENKDGKLQKSFIVGGLPLKRLIGGKKLPVVLFEPNHLRLLASPEMRRELIDTLIEQLDGDYSGLLRRYSRTLAQRNHLLKNSANSHQQLFVWDVRLSELGGQIVDKRLALIERLNPIFQKLYKAISGRPKTITKLAYQTNCSATNYGSSMLKLLEKSHSIDYERGFTGLGPHRDDIFITINEQSASQTASRGETRSLLLALKVAQLTIIKSESLVTPLILLDDVFSELDGARRQALTSHLSGYQTFITTTDADVVVQHFMDKCHIIPLG